MPEPQNTDSEYLTEDEIILRDHRKIIADLKAKLVSYEFGGYNAVRLSKMTRVPYASWDEAVTSLMDELELYRKKAPITGFFYELRIVLEMKIYNAKTNVSKWLFSRLFLKK